MPSAVNSIPAAISDGAPNRSTSRGARVEVAKIVSVIGRKPSPASIAS